MQSLDAIRTSDPNIATYLVALDYPILRVEGSADRVEFVFPSSIPEDVLLGYYNSGTAPARKLLNAHRDLLGPVRGCQRRR